MANSSQRPSDVHITVHITPPFQRIVIRELNNTHSDLLIFHQESIHYIGMWRLAIGFGKRGVVFGVSFFVRSAHHEEDAV